MPTVTVHAPELAGETGLFLFLRSASAGVLLNAGGDALTETVTGVFTATVAEAISSIHHARVHSSSTENASTGLRDGWIATAGTLVVDDYASALDYSGFMLAILAGACSDAGTSAETYAITINGNTFTADYTGLDATGNRSTTTLTKT